MSGAHHDRHCWRGVCAAAVVWLLASALPLEAADRYDPRLRFRVITTPHFTIYYQVEVAPQARRLAEVVEDVHRQLAGLVPSRGRGRTHVILVDQSDLPGGWATPLPVNTIELSATAPAGHDLLGNTDDWLRLVFTHEYTHILHLDRSAGWSRAVRAVFGRAPLAFPNLFLPIWQIEGLATYEESAKTGMGRLRSGEFSQLVREPARADRHEPLDRVSGGLVDWPAGSAPYAYGGHFHEYLARRFGAGSLAKLADETAARLPFLGSRAFPEVFGQSLGELWRAYAQSIDVRPAGEDGRAAAVRLTRRGFLTTAPRWDPSGALIWFGARTPHDFPSIDTVTPDGSATSRIHSRFLGTHVAPAAGVVYFDQIELARNAALRSDLYRLDVADLAHRPSGSSTRLTRERRALEPDLSPDGRLIACIVLEPGRRALATLAVGEASGSNAPPAEPVIVVSEPDTQFAAPRWSPDGRSIAVERRRLGGPSEIVTVDAARGTLRVLVASTGARNVTPAWMPDGRTLLFASDRGGGPFNLYAVDVDDGAVHQVTDLPAGARAPDVAPGGATIAFLGYTLDGYDVFKMPVDRSSWRRVDPAAHESPSSGVSDPVSSTAAGVGVAGPQAVPPLEPRGYSPWPTLRPWSWSPEIDWRDERLRVGASTTGTDVLGRHAYAARALWNADQARADWNVWYTYVRWRPTLFAAVADDTEDDALRRRVQQRIADVGVILPIRRARWSTAWLGVLRWEREAFGCAGGANDGVCLDLEGVRSRRHALRLGWALSGARQYGYSVSAEEGATVLVTSEHVRTGLGADGDADAFTGELRAFARAGPRHAVIAARVGGGTSRGDPGVRRVFALGGSGPASAGFDFGEDSLGLLRGFSTNAVHGRHAALVNLDYRLPLAYVERGIGTWPFFARAVHAGVFVDAGHAWSSSSRLRDLKTSIGAELSLDAVLWHTTPLTFTLGGAWRRDGADPDRGGASIYARIGRAF